MENASKALIIAGAILLSILLISLGIMVYNNAKGTVGNANLSKEEVSAFNSQWESYTGTGKTASEIKTMFSAIISSNRVEASNLNRIVKVSYAAKVLDGVNAKVTNKAPTQIPNISSNKMFKVVATYSNGLIVTLTISAA